MWSVMWPIMWLYPADQWDEEYVLFLLDCIESPSEEDVEEQVPDAFLNMILSFNQHFTGRGVFVRERGGGRGGGREGEWGRKREWGEGGRERGTCNWCNAVSWHTYRSFHQPGDEGPEAATQSPQLQRETHVHHQQRRYLIIAVYKQCVLI